MPETIIPPGLFQLLGFRRPRIPALLVLLGGLLGMGAAPAPAQSWTWSHPYPHGNNIADLVRHQGFLVQVTDFGGIYTTTNPAIWDRQESGTRRSLRSATSLGTRLLISGEEGLVLWSDDTRSFAAATLTPPTTDWLEGIAAAPDRAVAVGDNGAIYQSIDGTAWNRVEAGFSQWLSSVVWGGDRFVAVGEQGFLATSTNGTAWEAVSSGTRSNLWRVVYGGGEFMAVGSGGVVLLSTNGVQWTRAATEVRDTFFAGAQAPGQRLAGGPAALFLSQGEGPWKSHLSSLNSTSPAPDWSYTAALYTDDRFLIAGRTGVLVEGVQSNGGPTPPTAWFRLEDSPRTWLWSMTQLGSTYLAVGDRSAVLSSPGGVEWTLESLPLTNTPTLYGVGGSADLAVAVGDRGTLLVSRNSRETVLVTNEVVFADRQVTVVTTNTVEFLGVEWTNIVHGLTTNTLQGVAWNGERYAVVGNGGVALHSADGLQWTASSIDGRTNFFSGLAWWRGRWYASGNVGVLASSENLIDWTSRSLGVTNWIYRVRAVADRLVAVGQGGFLRTSTNGVDWTAHPRPTTQWITDAAAVDGFVYLTGTGGTILRSADLVTWETVPIPTGKGLYTGLASGGRLLVAGAEGIILRAMLDPAAGPVAIPWYRHDLSGTPVDLFQFTGNPEQPFELLGTENLPGGWGVDATLKLDSLGERVFGRETFAPRRFYQTRTGP